MLTSFIGREEAVRDVAGLLEEYRLVTVTGPGGVGKTRLADQVAKLVAGRFADGAWLAERAAVRDLAQVAAVVAAALGEELCAATGRAAEALTLWAACAAVDQREGPIYRPWFETRREDQQRQARQALEPGRARAAEDRGAAMSLATAAEYALMLTDPGPQYPQATPELAKLSARERELVALVAQGLTNAQIAAQLYISVRTVTSHLDRIRDKTGCRRRADLTRLALIEGLL